MNCSGIRNAVYDKLILWVVDESNIFGTQYLNILVGSLETPHVSFLSSCQSLSCSPNADSIAQAIDEAVRSLGTNQNSFRLLLSDAARYMLAASTVQFQDPCTANCFMSLVQLIYCTTMQ